MAGKALAMLAFRWRVLQGRIAQHQRVWLLAYQAYRSALDLQPKSWACWVRLGHCLKELDLYEAAECAFRSALLLGAPLEDIAEHLLFIADHCDWQETHEALRSLSNAISRGDGAACELPTLDEIVSMAAAHGVIEQATATQCAQWMRERITRSELKLQVVGGFGARRMDGDGGYGSGFPARQPPRFNITLLLRWLSLKLRQRLSGQTELSLSLQVAMWFERLEERNPPPDPVSNNAMLTAGITPKLSIVIVNFNKAHLTLKSVKSVLAASVSVPFEIIVVDNGSNGSEHEILKAADGPFRLLRQEQNLFFGEGSNLGTEAARGEFVLFLNNDAFLLPGAVELLMEAFAENEDCGATGPVFYYPDGRLQEAGAFVNAYGASRQRGRGDPWFRLEALPRFDVVDYVSGACLMMKRSVFRQLGGFDRAYAPAYYEDTDLCLKLRELSLKVYLARESRCVHIEGASSSLLPSHNVLSARTAGQRRIFVSRWGRSLRGRAMYPPSVE
jgi:GT2 family glycosyltransferase